MNDQSSDQSFLSGANATFINDLYKEWKEKPDLKSINTNNSSAPNWAKELKHNERRK